jgi:hypothetical protein
VIGTGGRQKLQQIFKTMKTKLLILALIFSLNSFTQGNLIKYNGNLIKNNGSLIKTTSVYFLDSIDVYIYLSQSQQVQTNYLLIPADSSKYTGIIHNAYIFNPLAATASTTIGEKLQFINVGTNTNGTYSNYTVYSGGFGDESIQGYLFTHYNNRLYCAFKCAVGATGFDDKWSKGLPLYTLAIGESFPRFLDTLIVHHLKPNIKIIDWWQGETCTTCDSSGYLGLMTTFFNNITTDLQSYFDSRHIYFNRSYHKVITELKPTSTMYHSGVAAAERQYCRTSSNNAIIINVNGYAFQGDSLHLSEMSHIAIAWKKFKQIKDY